MQLQRIIGQVKRLPATPQLLPRLMQVLKDPNASSDEIVDMIKLDMSVAAQVQRLSNSTYYGFAEPSRDLHQAITRIGMQETYKLVAAVLSQQMTAKPLTLPGLNGPRIWENSIACALTMELLANELDRETVNAYSIGLFHNIGIILIGYAASDSYAQAFVKAQQDGISLIDAEREIFGFDHAEAAGVLLRQWKFPESIVEPIAMQYIPHQSDEHASETAMIALTHYIIEHLEMGIPHTWVYEDTLAWVYEHLGIDHERVEELIEHSRANVKKVRDMLGASVKTA